MTTDAPGGVVPEYGYADAAPRCAHAYLRDAVRAMLPADLRGVRILDVGCGSGAMLGWLCAQGATGVGLDPSGQGIAAARAAFKGVRFERELAATDILARLNEPPFDVVISTEVVEHVYAPRDWAIGCASALRPGGALVCSTPYHGYLKNLVLSLTNSWDKHWNPLWDGGHIKFWSRRTLEALLREAGLRPEAFRGAGRVPMLWKSMLIRAVRSV
jgi:2-polyprenyl-3-methyl-5-hydroxy-6-metoxy-1,4-benzoquinol methylase